MKKESTKKTPLSCANCFTKDSVHKFFFDFSELFVAPVIIKIFHVAVQIAMIIGLLGATFSGAWWMFLLIIPGVFVVRFYFEFIMAIFSINNNLLAMKDNKKTA